MLDFSSAEQDNDNGSPEKPTVLNPEETQEYELVPSWLLNAANAAVSDALEKVEQQIASSQPQQASAKDQVHAETTPEKRNITKVQDSAPQAEQEDEQKQGHHDGTPQNGQEDDQEQGHQDGASQNEQEDEQEQAHGHQDCTPQNKQEQEHHEIEGDKQAMPTKEKTKKKPREANKPKPTEKKRAQKKTQPLAKRKGETQTETSKAWTDATIKKKLHSAACPNYRALLKIFQLHYSPSQDIFLFLRSTAPDCASPRVKGHFQKIGLKELARRDCSYLLAKHSLENMYVFQELLPKVGDGTRSEGQCCGDSDFGAAL